MATKKCANGHLYDPAIYGDNCPFCPSATSARPTVNSNEVGGGTQVLNGGGKTQVLNGGGKTQVLNQKEPEYNHTIPLPGLEDEIGGGGTVIRHAGGLATGETGMAENRRLVGLLVSYSAVPTGEVYKVYEGRTTIGRDRTCDIPFPKDHHMSSKHLLIQYVEAKGTFKAKDMGSSNGSNVNGNIYVMDETIDLKTNDKIVLGSTLFVFLAIPN